MTYTKATEAEMKEAFDGLESSYRAMQEEIDKKRPTCHFRKMSYEMGEYGESWFECNHCGHTKELTGATYEP